MEPKLCKHGHHMTETNTYIEIRKDGRRYSHCKICRFEVYEKFKKKNPAYFRNKNKQFRQTIDFKIKTKRDRTVYRKQWIKYFTVLYGTNPKCQICEKKLFWTHIRHNQRVCFDHRHGNESIVTKSPRTWLQNRPCNQENIEKFMSCDFGILCSKCNANLPTRNRSRYAKKLIEYLEECRS